MNKSTKVFFVLLVIVVVVGVVIYMMAQRQSPEAEGLDAALEAVGGESVDVPAADPLGEVVPDVNPIEKTNPFSDGYQNPFE